MYMLLEDDLDQAEESWRSYHTQFNVSFHFRNVFYFIAVWGWLPVCCTNIVAVIGGKCMYVKDCF